MSDRIPQFPPVIDPVKEEGRPLWSVMIPTYNCTAYLKAALESVLQQDEGEELMQIEVVDDYSTDGDVDAVVREAGRGRVTFYRQPANVGSLRNFETCINRSKGTYVHLLHGDDLVKAGFYKEVERLFKHFPQAGAAFTKNAYINRNGIQTNTERSLQKAAGIIDNFLEKIAVRQLLQPPAMVVKRSVYETLGSFYAVHCGEDWEMWARIAANYPVAYSPECLALYRVHEDNITSHSFTNGQQYQDIMKVVDIIQSYLPPDKRKHFKNLSLQTKAEFYARNANAIYKRKPAIALAHTKGSLKLHKSPKALFFISLVYIKHLLSKLRKKVGSL